MEKINLTNKTANYNDGCEDLEIETSDSTDSSASPYDPDKIRVDTHNFSLQNIIDMIYEGEVDLAPDFQRGYIWGAKQQSLLIESLLLRIPIPVFYLSSNELGTLQVVDGIQRLSAIYNYVKKESYKLSELEYLKEGFIDKTYSELAMEMKARIKRTQLTFNIIDPKTPEEVKFDIFRRLNTGGEPLTDQEIRHCMSPKRTRSFFKNICKSEEFSLLPISIVENKRMANRELILRAIAYNNYYNIIINNDEKTKSFFNKNKTLKGFITDVNLQINNLSDDELNTLELRIRKSIKLSFDIFGDNAFMKTPSTFKKKYPINKSLFETITSVFSHFESSDIIKNKDKITAGFKILCDDDLFIDSISKSTSKENAVKFRFISMTNMIKGAINEN